MNIDEAICTRLRDLASVRAVLGIGSAQRVHPLVLPEKPVFPAATYDLANVDRVGHYEGASGLATSIYEFTTWAKTLSEARSAAEVLRRGLEAFQGTITSPTDASTVYINGIFADPPGGGYDYNDDLKVFGVIVTLHVAYNEPPSVVEAAVPIVPVLPPP
jgi:hypothetical protein